MAAKKMPAAENLDTEFIAVSPGRTRPLWMLLVEGPALPRLEFRPEQDLPRRLRRRCRVARRSDRRSTVVAGQPSPFAFRLRLRYCENPSRPACLRYRRWNAGPEKACLFPSRA